MNTALPAIRQTAAAMIDAYTEASEEIRRAYELLHTARQRLAAAFDTEYRFRVLPDSHARDRVTVPQCLQGLQADGYRVRASIKCDAWRAIADRLEMRGQMSTARAEEFDKTLENADALPDLTMDALVGMIETHATRLDQYLTEAVTEVFNLLRPPRSEYKTNTELAVRERCILTAFYSDRWVTRPRLDYRLRQDFHNLDNVFHLLDGKGPIPHTSPLVAAIDACPEFGQVIETEYFRVRVFAKGSAHIQFRRMDLVEKLNALAGGRNLTPAAV